MTETQKHRGRKGFKRLERVCECVKVGESVLGWRESVSEKEKLRLRNNDAEGERERERERERENAF